MSATTRITNSYLTVEVAALGAETQAISSADGRDWLWNGDAAWWNGRAPILFPMVGRAPNDRIVIEGRSYDMAQHGFARRSTFTLAAANETSCRYELTASEATHALYPFEFLLSVTHAIDSRKLTVTAEVENRDVRTMPFGFGYHPAFVWPLPGAEGKSHTITLGNGGEPALVRIEDGLIDPTPLPSPFSAGHLTLSHAQFKADAMVFPEGTGTTLIYAAEDGPSLDFSFDNLPNFALWQKPGAPYICIEPWHGMAAEVGGSADMVDRPGAVLLPPRQKARFAFSVELPA